MTRGTSSCSGQKELSYGPLTAHRIRILIAGNRAAYWGTSAIAVGRRVIAGRVLAGIDESAEAGALK